MLSDEVHRHPRSYTAKASSGRADSSVRGPRWSLGDETCWTTRMSLVREGRMIIHRVTASPEKHQGGRERFGLSRGEWQHISWHHLTARTSGEQRGEDTEETGEERGNADGGQLARNERTRWRHRAGRVISTRWQVSIIYHLYTIKKYTLTTGSAQNKLNSNSKAYGNKTRQFKRL